MRTTRMAMGACLLASLVGCSSAPISYAASSPTPQDGLYACALRTVNELDYSVTTTNKDAGFISAEHRTSTGLGEDLTVQKYHDVLTISILEQPAGGPRRLRVTVGQTRRTTVLLGRSSESNIAPSDKGKADANTVLAACAPGSPIT
jgi:hypothetical protein